MIRYQELLNYYKRSHRLISNRLTQELWATCLHKRSNIDWDLLHALITKPEWNADLPRMTLCVQWMNNYSDPDRLSKHHVKDLQGRLSTLTKSNHVSITGSNRMANDSESQQGSEEEEDGADTYDPDGNGR
jgi:hypothetical protein